MHLRHGSFVLPRNVIWFHTKFVSIIIHKDFYPIAFKFLSYCPPVCTHPYFLVTKKPQFCKILISKILQVMCLTFSSYFINNLPIYLIFLNLRHFPISRNFFVIWHSDSQTTGYLVLLDFIAKSSFFQYLR